MDQYDPEINNVNYKGGLINLIFHSSKRLLQLVFDYKKYYIKNNVNLIAIQSKKKGKLNKALLQWWWI